MNKKNATPKTESSANITSVNFTTKPEPEQLYEMLRSGSLVTVSSPGDLVVVSRFMTVFEAQGDHLEPFAAVLDLMRHGRVTVEVIA